VVYRCHGGRRRAGLRALQRHGDVPVHTVLCIQPRETRGLRIEETWQGTGLWGSRSDTVVFEQAFVPHTALVGKEGRGDAVLAVTDAPTLLGLAAASLGCGEAAVRAAARMLGGRLEPGALPPPVALDLAGAVVALRARRGSRGGCRADGGRRGGRRLRLPARLPAGASLARRPWRSADAANAGGLPVSSGPDAAGLELITARSAADARAMALSQAPITSDALFNKMPSTLAALFFSHVLPV